MKQRAWNKPWKYSFNLLKLLDERLIVRKYMERPEIRWNYMSATSERLQRNRRKNISAMSCCSSLSSEACKLHEEAHWQGLEEGEWKVHNLETERRWYYCLRRLMTISLFFLIRHLLYFREKGWLHVCITA